MGKILEKEPNYLKFDWKFSSFTKFGLTLSPNVKRLISFSDFGERVHSISEKRLNFFKFGERVNSNWKKFSAFFSNFKSY